LQAFGFFYADNDLGLDIDEHVHLYLCGRARTGSLPKDVNWLNSNSKENSTSLCRRFSRWRKSWVEQYLVINRVCIAEEYVWVSHFGFARGRTDKLFRKVRITKEKKTCQIHIINRQFNKNIILFWPRPRKSE